MIREPIYIITEKLTMNCKSHQLKLKIYALQSLYLCKINKFEVLIL
jgi:hypothetical protein